MLYFSRRKTKLPNFEGQKEDLDSYSSSWLYFHDESLPTFFVLGKFHQAIFAIQKAVANEFALSNSNKSLDKRLTDLRKFLKVATTGGSIDFARTTLGKSLFVFMKVRCILLLWFSLNCIPLPPPNELGSVWKGAHSPPLQHLVILFFKEHNYKYNTSIIEETSKAKRKLSNLLAKAFTNSKFDNFSCWMKDGWKDLKHWIFQMESFQLRLNIKI